MAQWGSLFAVLCMFIFFAGCTRDKVSTTEAEDLVEAIFLEVPVVDFITIPAAKFSDGSSETSAPFRPTRKFFVITRV